MLRIEDDFDLAGPGLDGLPTRPNQKVPPDPQGLDGFGPQPVPILIRHRLDRDPRLVRFVELHEHLPQPRQMIGRPDGTRPIDMEGFILLHSTLDRRVAKQTQHLGSIE
jgi:hypothetical protein